MEPALGSCAFEFIFPFPLRPQMYQTMSSSRRRSVRAGPVLVERSVVPQRLISFLWLNVSVFRELRNICNTAETTCIIAFAAYGRKRACGEWLGMGAYDLSNKLRPAVASLILQGPVFRDRHAFWALALWLVAWSSKRSRHESRRRLSCHTGDQCFLENSTAYT